MNRVVSISSLFAIMIALSGCAADRGAGDDGEVVSPAVVGAGEPGATCDPNDPGATGLLVIPVTPTATLLLPTEIRAQLTKSDETCDQLPGYAWDGRAAPERLFASTDRELFASEESARELSPAPQSWCEEMAETLPCSGRRASATSLR
jgi:hypothetical protein